MPSTYIATAGSAIRSRNLTGMDTASCMPNFDAFTPRMSHFSVDAYQQGQLWLWSFGAKISLWSLDQHALTLAIGRHIRDSRPGDVDHPRVEEAYSGSLGTFSLSAGLAREGTTFSFSELKHVRCQHSRCEQSAPSVYDRVTLRMILQDTKCEMPAGRQTPCSVLSQNANRFFATIHEVSDAGGDIIVCRHNQKRVCRPLRSDDQVINRERDKNECTARLVVFPGAVALLVHVRKLEPVRPAVFLVQPGLSVRKPARNTALAFG